MAGINCDLVDVIVDEMCSPSPGGTGDRLYAFPRKLVKKLAISEDGSLKAEEFKAAVTGQVIAIDIKSESGQYTASGEQGKDVNSGIIEVVIDKGLDEFLKNDKAFRYKDLAYALARPDGKYYVLYSSFSRVKYTTNYDSGKVATDDHGFTCQFEASAMEQSYMFVDLGEDDMDDLLASAAKKMAAAPGYQVNTGSYGGGDDE